MATIKSSIQLFDRASPALRSMSNALNICINSFESMQKASNSSVDVSSIKLAKDELVKVETNINDIDNQINNARKEQENFNTSIRNGTSATNNFKNSFMKLAGTIGTALGVNQLLKISDEMVSIEARLNMIKSENEDVAELQNKIFQSAQRSRGSYQDTADAIGKMGIMAKDAFSSTDELVAFMEQINKQFVIAGTAPEGVKAAMLQLTQAMSSGVLRGEELNSVFEQAPTIIQGIAEYLGEPIGKIRELAKEGLITSEIVKNAMFYMADETNTKFENMPKTFGQIKQVLANEAQMAFQPVLQKINQLLNTDKFNVFTNNAITCLTNLANISIEIFNTLIAVADVVADNWSTIEPIIMAALAALLLYKGTALITTTINSAMALSESVKAAKLAISTGATFAATAAQYGFNAALYACPITWVIVIIIALIGSLFALCNWIAKTTDKAETGFGIMAGSFAAMAAIIVNTGVGMINAIITAVNSVIRPIAKVIEWIVNTFSGGFDNIFGAFLNLLGQMINLLLGFVKIITPVIDAIFGTEWTEGLTNLQNDIDKWGKNENATTWKAEIPIIDWRMDISDTFDVGTDWGDSIANKVKGLFGGKDEIKEDDLMEPPNYDDLLEKIKVDAMNTSINTDKLTDTMEWLDEDIRYLVDVAERESINQFTTAEIKVETTNNNKIDSNFDLDEMIDKFNDGLLEVLQTAAEGVH